MIAWIRRLLAAVHVWGNWSEHGDLILGNPGSVRALVHQLQSIGELTALIDAPFPRLCVIAFSPITPRVQDETGWSSVA